eukprot:TRINITY_DN2367_c0_g1_i8.p1 TRINITY_DN2367_c0_g1~~TRINITY_DN2367_c0_g1_i8.p1  ORF type:complete len:693 (-),score=150.94 TRINITY_DN2367_c0_g1_i8:786-2864(-)
MPGTIQVSVLDLVELPSSSSSSPVSVKVAMGKREYQTWDKGEFLFPLMTLRDNLVITLHDAEGNEISRTDVKTMSVVEKGVWDDLFPLKGGGQVHMKLQFILSEEERKQIQYMRESVVKKKEELIKKSPMHSEIATDPVVSVLPESVVQTKDASVSKEPIKDFVLNQMVHHEDSKPRHTLQDGQSTETTPDRREALSTTPFFQVQNNTERSVHNLLQEKYNSSKETFKPQSPPVAIESYISSKEGLDPQLQCSAEDNDDTRYLASLLGENKTHISQTETSAEKIKSNVKKLIGTFESNLCQGPRPCAIRLTKSHSNMIEMEKPLKGTQIDKNSDEKGRFIQQDKDTKAASFSVGSLQVVNLQQSAKHIRSLYTKKPVGNVPGKQDLLVVDVKKGSSIAPRIKENQSFEEKIVYESCGEGRHGTIREYPSDILDTEHHSVKATNPRREKTVEVDEDPRSIRDDNFQVSQEELFEAGCIKETRKVKEAFWEKLGEAAAVEKARLTGPANTDLQLGLSTTQQESDCNVYLEKCGCKTYRKDYEKPAIYGASKGKQKVLIYNKAEHCLLENLGSLIFQDETRHLCITTAGKKLRNMIGGFSIYDKTHPSETNAERTVESKICSYTHEIDEHDRASSDFGNPIAERSSGVAKNGGSLIEQVIRVVIIAACGTIFYSTRQRKTRSLQNSIPVTLTFFI